MSGGGYLVTYLNASQVNCYGNGDIVTYTPTSRYDNGVQTRPFNPPPPGGPTTLGLHGIVKIVIPGGGGALAPLVNATVWATNGQGFSAFVRTNGLGYFSVFYDNDNPNIFWSPVNHPTIRITGTYNNCVYRAEDFGPVWLPNFDPNSPYYYANLGAEADLGTMIGFTSTPGCGP
ncbi:MAG: hypothetical protein ACKVRN_04600 [Pyrinomonadaceae bacterium]